MVFENNYPQKIKALIDELKYSKDKLKAMDEELKREQRVSTQIQFNNSNLIEQVRELKKMLIVKNPQNLGDFTSVAGKSKQSAPGEKQEQKLEPTDNMKSSVLLNDRSQSVIMDPAQNYELIEQLEKKNQVLAKSKESLFRKNNI